MIRKSNDGNPPYGDSTFAKLKMETPQHIAEQIATPPPRGRLIEWYSAVVENEERLFVQYAPHLFVNIASAVKLRIPIGGRVWGDVASLMAVAFGSAGVVA